MRQVNRQRHQFAGLVAGVAEHQALIARALVEVDALAFVHALRDVLRLLAVLNQHRAGVGIEANRRVGVADAANRVARDLRVIDFCAGGNFACQHGQVVLDEGFCGDARARVLG